MPYFRPSLIAPCGMNCGICKAYLREKNTCPGCKAGPTFVSCQNCNIPKCEIRKGAWCLSGAESRGDSEKPCDRLKNLDKRYRAKYGMSMIENLEYIRDNGIEEFLNNEEKRWVSNEGVFCVHDKQRYKGE